MVIPGTRIYWPELPLATKLSDWLGKFQGLNDLKFDPQRENMKNFRDHVFGLGK